MNENIRRILDLQHNPDTRIRFSNLSNGAVLKRLPTEELSNLYANMLIKCGFVHQMGRVKETETLIFDEKSFYCGYFSGYGYQWSLDMYDYANPYVVDLV